MGREIQKGTDVAKGSLGLSRDKQGQEQLAGFQRTPQQIEAENDLLKILTAQAQGISNPMSELAAKKALAIGASQSSQSSNPFLGIKAAQDANILGQDQARMNAQAQLSDLLTGQRSTALQATSESAKMRQDENQRRSDFLAQLAASGAAAATKKGK